MCRSRVYTNLIMISIAFSFGVLLGFSSRHGDVVYAGSTPPCDDCDYVNTVYLPTTACASSSDHETVLVYLENNDVGSSSFTGNACFVETGGATTTIVSCLKDVDRTLDSGQDSHVAVLVAPEGSNPDSVYLYECSGDGYVGVLTSRQACLDCAGDVEDACEGLNCGSETGSVIFSNSCRCFTGGSCGGGPGDELGWQKAEVLFYNADTSDITLTYWWEYDENCVNYEDTTTVEVTISAGQCQTATKWIPIFNANFDGAKKLNYIVTDGNASYLSTDYGTSCCDDLYGSCTTQCSLASCP